MTIKLKNNMRIFRFQIKIFFKAKIFKTFDYVIILKLLINITCIIKIKKKTFEFLNQIIH